MNLTKYFMIELPMDDSFGPDDIPPIWNLKKYSAPGTTMNHAGDSHDAYSVIIDSALGVVGAAPKDNDEFLGHVQWLQEYLTNQPPPKYPFPIDAARAAAGKAVFDEHCASCHASDKTGRRMALAGIDTDPARIGTWNKSNAVAANQVVTEMGIVRKGLVEEDLVGYNPPFLDGIWARAPYLHNGSVPTLRDLLEPAANRPKLFWRGYDLYDPDNVGFVAQGAEAERVGTRHDTTQRANYKRRARVRHDVAGRRQGELARVPEDALSARVRARIRPQPRASPWAPCPCHRAHAPGTHALSDVSLGLRSACVFRTPQWTG